MDKKDGGNIDLESLRGFTPGPWHWVNGDTDEPYDLKAQWDGFGRPSLRTVRETTPPFAIYTLPEFILDAEPFDPRDEANARLIAAAPSMHAELTARRARDAEVEALVAADLELNRAIEAAGGFVEEGYESESYGVYGSDFERCLACDAESGAGVLNKGVTHEADCVRHRYEVALERRAEALAPFTGAKP